MGLHDPFGFLKHKLWPKEGSGVKLPLKVGSHLDSLACRWYATYCWKVLDEGYKFALYFTSIEGQHTKLWAPKFAGVPI